MPADWHHHNLEMITPTSVPGLEASLEGRLRFETLLSDLAAQLANLEPEELDDAIESSLADLRGILGGDRGGIALFAEDGALYWRHGYVVPGADPGRLGRDLAEGLPWYRRELREGRRVVLERLPDDWPEEATAEREYTTSIGLKSHLALPLKAGGEVLGILGMAYMVETRRWSPELLSRLELLASVYAEAVFRRRAQVRLQELDDLNHSVLESVPNEILVLDGEGRIVAFNEAWSRSVRRARYPRARLGGGVSYVDAAERAAREDRSVVGIESMASGLRAVLSGEQTHGNGRYTYSAETGDRAFLWTATPLGSGSGGAVVVHTDVTELEKARTALERSLEEVQALKERLEAENAFLGEQARHAQGFEDIVGTSDALARVLAQVEQVASTDAHVLLLGETGTGKDVIARALHQRSQRSDRPLVTINCAALPAALIESELFGYEQGAFTGALQRTVGRFEVAHGGSILLDEVGETPLEVQAKLLRVLQTGEFERLGSPKTIKVDVRILAATNRDLEAEVKAGRFRADLYYRLSVFPIVLPPLRERREDIPLLVWHFISHNQGRLGRSVKRVPERLMRAFTACSWPGNVRELHNVVERALIMTKGADLAADPLFLEAAPSFSATPGASLAEMERAHILSVMEECGWKLSGRGNAAERLGLNRSTLQFRMKKLGITRPQRGS